MKRKVYNLRKEAAEPQIGIFWLYQGQVLQFSQPVGAVAPINGFKDSNYTHDAYWGQMQKMFPELADKEYFDVPRGRVVFAVNGTYYINLPAKEAKDRSLVDRISRNFTFPRGKVVVQTDEHYNPAQIDWDD